MTKELSFALFQFVPVYTYFILLASQDKTRKEQEFAEEKIMVCSRRNVKKNKTID